MKSLRVAVLAGVGVIVVALLISNSGRMQEEIVVVPPSASAESAVPETGSSVPTTSPVADGARHITPEAAPGMAGLEANEPTKSPLPPPSAGLIFDGKIVPGKAMQLLDGDFGDLLAELAQQARLDAEAAEMRQLYIDQITALLAGTEVTLRRIECGSSVCAAELFRADGADPTDPFAEPGRVDDQLPRDARVELSFLDADGNALRRFIFSVDPAVNSLYVPGRDR